MSQQIDLNRYLDFVAAVTSNESNDFNAFVSHLIRLNTNYEAYGLNGEMQHGPDVIVPLLLTASIGLSAETGEFSEIIKKILFQGKPLNDDNVFHLKRELGDIIWYWINACRALHLNPNDVIEENILKLQARYPGGVFDAYHSENRKKDDI